MILIVSIQSCARCGQDHTNLEFKQFTNPVEDSDGTMWTHWALCPVNGEPILLKSKPQEPVL